MDTVKAAERVIAAVEAATPGERQEGALWHRQAHNMARILSVVARTDRDRAAGVLAALSPLNRWEDNISDAFRLARNIESRVCTTHPNRDKAIRILAGGRPEEVLSGRKVCSFWHQIADPLHCRVLPIDRHLYWTAAGDTAPRDAAPSNDREYTLIEHAYQDAADHLRLPVAQVGATAWLVSRRRARYGLAFGEDRTVDSFRPFCWDCGIEFSPRGWTSAGFRNWRCSGCGKSTAPASYDRSIKPRLKIEEGRWSIVDGDGLVDPGYCVRWDDRGRAQVQCGVGHPYANSAGWQYLYRFRAMWELGEKLRSDEHVHHRNGKRSDDQGWNLEVVAAEYHGSLHASEAVLAEVGGGRDEKGRFLKWRGRPGDPCMVARRGPIIGRAALG